MLPSKSNGARSVITNIWSVVVEDRRLLIGALLFAGAAIIAYAIVRHFRIS